MGKLRQQSVLADMIAAAVAPGLVMGMIFCLISFLILVFYRDGYQIRVNYLFALYIFASVLIARIAIESGRAYAMVYTLALGLAMMVVINRFAVFQGPLAIFSPLINLGLLALVGYLADRIVFDCTLVEADRDTSGEGLLQSLGLVRSDLSKDEKSTRKRKRKHNPGVTILYFALLAIPLYGIGQLFLPAGNDAIRRSALYLLFGYFFCSFALLVTTSFLGLRRYLNDRGVEVPTQFSATWLSLGVIGTLIFLGICLFLPLPGRQFGLFDLPFDVRAMDGLTASKWGWGKEGVPEADSNIPPSPQAVSQESQTNASTENPSQSSNSGNSSGQGSSGQSNSGQSNSGQSNSGQSNSGHSNSGQGNSGQSNSGQSNSGQSNSGQSNSGQSNSGQGNSGQGNSGQGNSGQGNSGQSNSGQGNSGQSNSGQGNSGQGNSGQGNSGQGNSGQGNSGQGNSGQGNSGQGNSGQGNSGQGNSGQSNSGQSNSGQSNSGQSNSGQGNSGQGNSGQGNSGQGNSGQSNSGQSNSGQSNSGQSNSGQSNSGQSNSGQSNSGQSNSGQSNSGQSNSGQSNSGQSNSGQSNSGQSNSGQSNSGQSNSGQSRSGYENQAKSDTNSGQSGEASSPSERNDSDDANDSIENQESPSSDSRTVEPRSESSSAQSPDSSESTPQSKFNWSSFSIGSWMGVLLKWITIAILFGIVAYFAIYHREELKRMWGDFLKWWRSLWGLPADDSLPDLDRVESSGPRRRSFASFANPFHRQTKMDLAELIRYTFDAMEAWGAERGVERKGETTAEEYVRSLSGLLPKCKEDLAGFSNAYVRLAYAGNRPVSLDPNVLQRIWGSMEQVAVSPSRISTA
jgi:PPE-repeat protein